ncbi:MAG: D-cysteine desulfhydrase family protein [Oscillibacter sp.]|nr:D-cysteine desulfhydrase family protein [Oscillibacter sp.]
MKALSSFSRIPLGVLPTPLYKLENLSRELGKNLYIKRDDLTGAALGGNKIRKLEFLLADAKDKGADVVLTAGGPQSNHAMLTAACAARLGMRSILVLKKRGELTGGNLILDDIFNAEVRFVDTDTYDDVYAEMERIMDRLRQEGHTPYFIPVGGSVPLGCLGYVRCVEEIAWQSKELGVDFDAIVSAVGSGGTYSGLTLGAKLFLPGVRSVGVGVCDDPFADIAYDLMRETAALLESGVSVSQDDIHIRYHIGPGYAMPSPEGCEAVRRLARREGILADPVYTGKALAGFFQLLEEGFFDGEENILFVHTGGAGALFAVDMV